MSGSPGDAAIRFVTGLSVFLFGVATAPWVAGAAVLALATAATERWRPSRVMTVVPFAAAIAALCRPSVTLTVLELAVPWLLMAAGAVHLVLAPRQAETGDRWWGLAVLVGLAEIDFGSWALGDSARAGAAVVFWTAALLMSQAVTQIVSMASAPLRAVR
ncbi:DUF308 domain-containing protein [Amycolatopsis sp. GM8]|uniref:DUF308 domain-containing protein n=1 Tax=Amycolatopsis sp. GM8 TaxID=2896530 RepID=UPI001F244BE0|nr:DUF308 domain-containing protein [Amycolatopsis sp. GM8]